MTLEIQQSANESRYCGRKISAKRNHKNKGYNTSKHATILHNTSPSHISTLLYASDLPLHIFHYAHPFFPLPNSTQSQPPNPSQHPPPHLTPPTTLPSIRHIRQSINLRRQIRNPKRLGNGIIHPSIHSHTRLFGSRIGRNTENGHMSFQ